MKKTTKLRSMLDNNEFFILPGGGCALHAKIAEAAGFKVAYMSGMNTCATIFGVPDAGLLTMDEMVENARRMAAAVEIPLIADADQGFGNAINVGRTVKEYIRAGVAGIHIEDQTSPKRCGFVKGKQLVPIEEAVGKYEAAVDARNELDPDFVIIARCDARTAVGGGVDEVIKRLRAYKKAGVDILYMEGPLTIDEIKAVRAAVDGPFTATTIEMRPLPSIQDHIDLGMSCLIVPSLISRAGYYESWDFAGDFMKRGMDAYTDILEARKDHPIFEFRLFSFLGFEKIREMEKKYLSAEAVKKYAESTGVYDPSSVL
ncbi:MAG: oxaloacetate decarboxylase [Oscillospiraceae bacterium]